VDKTWLVSVLLEAQKSDLGCLHKAPCGHILCLCPPPGRRALVPPLGEAAAVCLLC